jgi:WD40 repeat protein
MILCDLVDRRMILRSQHMAPAIAFSPDGELLALAHLSRFGGQSHESEQTVEIRRPSDGVLLRESGPLVDARLSSLAFSPDGAILAAGDWNSTSVHVWDAHTLVQPRTFQCTHNLQELTFANDGGTIVTSGPTDWRSRPTKRLAELSKWDSETLFEVDRQEFDGEFFTPTFSTSPAGATRALLRLFSPSEEMVLWDVDGSSELARARPTLDASLYESPPHAAPGVSLLYLLSPRDTIIAVGYRDNIVEFIEVADQRVLGSVKAHAAWKRRLVAARLTPTGKLVTSFWPTTHPRLAATVIVQDISVLFATNDGAQAEDSDM